MLYDGRAQFECPHHLPSACSDPLQARIEFHRSAEGFEQPCEICVERNEASNREAPPEIFLTAHSQNGYCPQDRNCIRSRRELRGRKPQFALGAHDSSELTKAQAFLPFLCGE